MRWLYSGLWYLALPLVLRRLKRRAQKAPAYGERIAERFGDVPARAEQPLWIHAVSVGETVAIAPLVKLLRKRQPDLPILLTTMTPTGAERVDALFGRDRLVSHHYCPYDLPHAVNRFLDRIQPRGLVVVETELWPNIVSACADRDVPVLLANARLSEKSARGYQKMGVLSRPMLQQLSCIAAQNKTDAGRFSQLGVADDKLVVTGSIKFDIAVPEQLTPAAQQLRAHWGETRPVLVAGSTHEGEESVLLRVYQTLLAKHPDLLLVLVPRHPERFDAVAKLIEESGLQGCRRSQAQQPDTNTQVYLGDTMGELMTLYAAADLTFVGGSLIERGGHNPLEPAALAKPVLMGAHVFNFAVICDALEAAGGLRSVDGESELQAAVSDLLAQPEQAAQQGAAAAAFVKANQGALEHLYQLVDQTCLTGRT